MTLPKLLDQGVRSPYCLSNLLLCGTVCACLQLRLPQKSVVRVHVGAHQPKIRAVLPGHAVCLSVPLAEGMHSPSCVSDLPLVRIVSCAGILHEVWAPLDPLERLQGRRNIRAGGAGI